MKDEVNGKIKLLYNFLFTNHTKKFTVKILFLAGYYRLAILLIPMKKLQKRFGEEGRESLPEDTYENQKTAFWIGERVERVCGKTSWESKCLVRALIAQKLLHEKNIHTTMYMGVNVEEQGLAAHAWLRCGTLDVTGGTGEGYAVVAKFYK